MFSHWSCYLDYMHVWPGPVWCLLYWPAKRILFIICMCGFSPTRSLSSRMLFGRCVFSHKICGHVVPYRNYVCVRQIFRYAILCSLSGAFANGIHVEKRILLFLFCRLRLGLQTRPPSPATRFSRRPTTPSPRMCCRSRSASIHSESMWMHKDASGWRTTLWF